VQIRFRLNGELFIPELDLGSYPPINDIHIVGGEGSIQTEPFSLRMAQTAQFSASISEAAIAGYVRAKLPDAIRSFELKLVSGEIVIHADVHMVFSLKVQVNCGIEVVNSQKLFVRVKSMDGVPGPAQGIVFGQLEANNPVLDAGTVYPGLKILNLEILEGHLRIEGIAEPI
jgi:hypothetical protein